MADPLVIPGYVSKHYIADVLSGGRETHSGPTPYGEGWVDAFDAIEEVLLGQDALNE